MKRLTPLFDRLQRRKAPAEAIAAGARLLKQAKHTVALTGAGLSTRSGIPDFRSPDSGVWQRVDPFEVASLSGFRRNPQAFYDWLRPLAQITKKAKPNRAHLALARLEKQGRLKAIITQNIDGLHTRAGSNEVIELHGHMREMHCLQCGRRYNSQQFLESFLKSGNIPWCDCSGLLKPAVTLFEEMLPRHALIEAQRHARLADVMIVAGSSLTVYPAAELPEVAIRNGGKLIIVNIEETAHDHLADVVIRADVAQALPALVAQLK